MPSLKLLGALISVVALGAIGVANASAAEFTASATGELQGKATSTQVFTFDSGTVECTGANGTGTISSTASTEQDLEVEYTGCKAFGLAGVHISKGKFRTTANGTVHLLNTITITVTKTLFTGHCSILIPPQTATAVLYVPMPPRLTKIMFFHGLVYNPSGGVCGKAGEYENGTFEGTNEVERVGGGSISWDE